MLNISQDFGHWNRTIRLNHDIILVLIRSFIFSTINADNLRRIYHQITMQSIVYSPSLFRNVISCSEALKRELHNIVLELRKVQLLEFRKKGQNSVAQLSQIWNLDSFINLVLFYPNRILFFKLNFFVPLPPPQNHLTRGSVILRRG